MEKIQKKNTIPGCFRAESPEQVLPNAPMKNTKDIAQWLSYKKNKAC